MDTNLCPGCKLPIDQCYYGGDCLEVQAINREQQREKLADIDIEGMGECMDCGGLVDKGYYLCFTCENGKES
jgi:hypothetical protein